MFDDLGPYRVVYLEAARHELKALCERAARNGLAAQVLAALTAINSLLQFDPIGFGEQTNYLAKAKLQKFHNAVPPLVVYYAVHTEIPCVFVNEFRPFPFDAF